MDPRLLIPIILVVVLVVVLGLYLWATYNALIGLKVRVDEAWSDILLQMKRRADLIPKLAGTVEGYAAHERGTLDRLVTTGGQGVAASSPAAATAAESALQQALKSVFSIAEGFPRLQADPAFLSLQSDLVESEEKIQASRRFYNGGVRELNGKIQVFPNNMWARRLGFSRREFFDVADSVAIAQPPRVQF